MRFVAATVKGWLDADVAPSSIGVLPGGRRNRTGPALALQDAGVAVELLQRDGPGNNQAVKIASMHRAKGTEFSRVVVVGAEAGVVPLDWVIESQPEADPPPCAGGSGRCSTWRAAARGTSSSSPGPAVPARSSRP